MSLRKFSLREIKARPLRVLLTFLSIAIGVAAVVAVLLATATTRSAQQRMLKALSGKADVELLANGSQGFAYDQIKLVRERPEVSVAIPSLIRIATVFVDDEKTRTQVLGIDPRVDQEIREYQVAAGRQIEGYDEVLLDEGFSKSLGVSVDATLKMLGPAGIKDYRVVGLARPTGSSGMSIGGAVYMLLPAAQQLFKTPGKVDQVLVLLKPEQDKTAFQAALQSALSDSVTVRVPRTSSDMAREAMYATQNGMHMAVAFALLIAAFIIYNTFQMAVGERRKQLGILRAIGATRRQVSGVILKEAAWLSVLGVLAGCCLGYWGAGWINATTEGILQVDLPTVEWATYPFVVATLLGIGVAMLGAWMPAQRAGAVQPMEAMRAVEIRYNDDVVRRATPLGFVAIPAGLALLATAIAGWLPVGSDVVAIVLVLLGCVLLIPMLLDRCSGWMVWLLSGLLGVEARLARKQVMRHVGRSTLTIGVLFIAISTCVGMTGNILDNVENVRAWYSRAFIGDFFVRASTPDFATGASTDLPADIESQITSVPGVDKVEKLAFVSAQSQQDSILVVTREFSGDAQNYFDLQEGRETGLLDKLNAGQVVVGSVLAQRRQLHVGDRIPVETADGQQQLTIAAITNEYIAGGLTVYMARPVAIELLDARNTTALIVSADKSRLAQTETALRKITSDRNLILQSQSEMVAFIDGMVNGVIASMWMLLSIGCVIAALGLINTLTMNILEQTREIGMLRVVAMTRSQVRRMVVAQATLLGALGLIPGALAGVFVAYAISQSAMAVLGHDVVFHFRPGLILGCMLLGMALIFLASLLPAERAARIKLSAALHYE